MKDKFFLNTLKQLNPSLETHLTDFVPFKFHGNDNLIKIGDDSLYFMKKKATVAIIYITPHLIFTHDNGDITADTLSRILNNDSIIPRPLIRLRGYDGRCVELFEYGYEPFFLHKQQTTESFHNFVEQIHGTFTGTYYLPYLIHPFRLLLGNKIYILSHLMHFIFAPYNAESQIKDLHYSHPLAFEKKNNEDLIEMTRCLILNFFHSLCMTFLWILNGNQGNSLHIRSKEIMGFIRNDDKRWYNPEKIKQKDNNIVIKPCRIQRGICQGLALYSSILEVDEIHTYACQHLLTTLPQTLSQVCKAMREKNDRQILIRAVEKEFMLFNTFCSKIKNEER